MSSAHSISVHRLLLHSKPSPHGLFALQPGTVEFGTRRGRRVVNIALAEQA